MQLAESVEGVSAACDQPLLCRAQHRVTEHSWTFTLESKVSLAARVCLSHHIHLCPPARIVPPCSGPWGTGGLGLAAGNGELKQGLFSPRNPWSMSPYSGRNLEPPSGLQSPASARGSSTRVGSASLCLVLAGITSG